MLLFFCILLCMTNVLQHFLCLEKPLVPDDLADDLCDVLFACQAAKVPWRSFLAHALALRRPLLAVIAACYEVFHIL